MRLLYLIFSKVLVGLGISIMVQTGPVPHFIGFMMMSIGLDMLYSWGQR